MRHTGKVAFRDGDRGFFDLACPYCRSSAVHVFPAQREASDAVKQAAARRALRQIGRHAPEHPSPERKRDAVAERTRNAICANGRAPTRCSCATVSGGSCAIVSGGSCATVSGGSAFRVGIFGRCMRFCVFDVRFCKAWDSDFRYHADLTGRDFAVAAALVPGG